MLAAVESLEARVISRLPLRPNRAGTMIRISETSLKNEKRQEIKGKEPKAQGHF
jgi:ribosome recycling factor